MSPATLSHSPSPPAALTLQSLLSQHADQPNSALSALLTQFNHITAQLAAAHARLAQLDPPKGSNDDLLRSRRRLQDENRQLWAVISKCKADIRDLKNENRELRHRLAELEPLPPPPASAPLTLQCPSPATSSSLDLHPLPSDSPAPPRPPLAPRSTSDPRRATSTNGSSPSLLPAGPLSSLDPAAGPLELSFESPFESSHLPSTVRPGPRTTSALPQASPSRRPSHPPMPLVVLQPAIPRIQPDSPPMRLSPGLHRRASSVDISRRPSSPMRRPRLPLTPHPSSSRLTTTPPPPGTSLCFDSDDNHRPGNHPAPLDLLRPLSSAASLTQHPYSAPLSTPHSVIPPEIRHYVLSNHSPISPINLAHAPFPSEQLISSDISGPTTESGPVPHHRMASPSLSDPALSSSLPCHSSTGFMQPLSPLPQSVQNTKTPQPDPNPSGIALSSLSASASAPPPTIPPPRHPKPTNSPTLSQLGPPSNSAASVHSSSSPATVPAPPLADTVYTTQPMTKRRMLTPAFLPFTRIKVTNSHIRANDKSKEVISFSITISVVIPPESDPEGKGAKASWIVEKLYSDVLSLDHAVKSKHSKVQNRSLAQLPDRALFKDHAPSKVDARKAVLQKYLQSLCVAQLTEKTDVCDFFNSNIVITERISSISRPGFMQGYLTKKGRNFGGWQTRFYVLEGPILEYFDTRGGNRLGHIVVTGAQIGRQQYRSQEANDDSYRHAFLIRMHKREKEGDIDHILCAETDEERDAWVDALTCYVTGRYISAEQASAAAAASSTNSVELPRRDASASSAALQFDPRLSKRQTSLDTSPRGELAHSLKPHRQSSSSYEPPFRSHKASHPLGKIEPIDQGSLTSDGGGPNRATAPTIPEEQSSSSNGRSAAPEPTVRTESQGASRVSISHADGREKEHHTPWPPHLDRRPSSHGSLNLPSGPSTPRPPVSQQTRLTQAQVHSSPQQETLASDADSIVTTPADRPSTPDSLQRPRISGPMNGAPITGGYRIKPLEEKKAKFRSAFWGFAGRNGVTDRNHQSVVPVNTNALFAPAPRPVFGVSLQEAVSVARVHVGLDLPAVVFRCVEFLEAKGAIEEEGIYRLSGSSVNIKSYKERFNTEGDYNLLESSKTEYHDVHAVAGLLKQFLRELASPILTRELHPEFLKVIDLSQRSDKVNELGRLCAELPLPNYTLLRFLSAHLIHVVQNEKVNKMSMRNVGIVFSPTLGMPAPLFALLLKEFDLVFNIEGDNRAPIRLPGNRGTIEQPALQVAANGTFPVSKNDQKRVSRNSMLYAATGADILMEHTKLPRGRTALNEDSDSDVDYDSSSEPDGPLELVHNLSSAPTREPPPLPPQRSPLRRRASLEVHSPFTSPLGLSSALPSPSPVYPPQGNQRLTQADNGAGLAPSSRSLAPVRNPSPRPRTAGA